MNRHQQEAKKYLSQAFGLNQRIESKLGQIEDLHDLATKATVTYSDMPKSPNRDGSRMEDAIIKIIDLENQINQDMMKLVELKKDIIRRIKAVESAELQTILELRYLSYMRWLPGNGAGVTRAKSRNERRGYESVFPSQISIDKRHIWL